MATIQRYTVDDLLQLPDDGNRYELLNGELVRVPPAGEDHGRIAQEINFRMLLWKQGRHQGIVTVPDTGFVIGAGTGNALMPDVAYIRESRLPPDRDTSKVIDTHPDAVVEIVSPSDRAIEVVRKVNTYLQAGVSLVWLVDPVSRTIDEYRPGADVVSLHEDDTADGGATLPGFQFRVGDIFPSRRQSSNP